MFRATLNPRGTQNADANIKFSRPPRGQNGGIANGFEKVEKQYD